MMQAAIGMITQFGQGLVTAIPMLAQKALPVLLGFTDSLRANFGQIVDAGIGFILNLMQGIMNSLPTLIAYVPQIVSNIAGLINDNAPKLLVAAGKLIVMLIQGLIAAVPSLLENMGNILKAVVDVITAINWINLGTTVIKAIGSGLKSMAGHLSNMMGKTFKGAIEYIKGLPKMALQWGKDMIQGFINGILGSIGGIRMLALQSHPTCTSADRMWVLFGNMKPGCRTSWAALQTGSPEMPHRLKKRLLKWLRKWHTPLMPH